MTSTPSEADIPTLTDRIQYMERERDQSFAIMSEYKELGFNLYDELGASQLDLFNKKTYREHSKKTKYKRIQKKTNREHSRPAQRL